MKMIAAIVIVLAASPVPAQAANWTTYRIPESGTSVDIPTSIFTEEAGKPDGYGQKFRTSDGVADLTVQTVPRQQGISPAAFLAAKQPPSGIVYKRIASDFFVVSSVKRDKIWYDRCNFTSRYVHCVLINYPADEKRQWDGVVTRISHSLSGG
ncbi:hypothetical protein ACFQZO_06295 [Bradyrhizobium sp. GCM10027634]|uniref:hypothetical protein n=1 Tax=unclassified Bradyrhizobium TaxID=2631580 RepID=UPI00188CB103|nr:MULTISPECIES: hypothetical protein [unclassified Bradyrhizobium]MDN5000489.1 hypothetical protein [Bradyrhizobium sp. WYCCWR 12677]QOZ42761.1 hypothetical protein XH89_04235 [Bradyrhizobium sp. CCBAU 53340]